MKSHAEMVDAVLSYHVDPRTCGVARFNVLLAERLGVPMLQLGSPCRYPLISVKPQEVVDRPFDIYNPQPFDLFLHGPTEASCLTYASRIYAANSQIADAIRRIRPDVIEAFCPATLGGNPHRAKRHVLVFGMAGKINNAHGYYTKLKRLLDETGQGYTVSLSTAIHDGGSVWDKLSSSSQLFAMVFGTSFRSLGYLADDALAKELRDCTAAAIFFEPALRVNNTTFWACVDAQVPVITNLDCHSPVLGFRVHDIDKLTAWPTLPRRQPSPHDYTWDHLLRIMSHHA